MAATEKSRVSEKLLKPTLKDQGIDANLAARCRKMAKMEKEDFEAAVAKAVTIAIAAVEASRGF